MNKKTVIAILIILSAFIGLAELCAKDFLAEFKAFSKEKTYKVDIADKNGVMIPYLVVGTITYKYTTEGETQELDVADRDRFSNYLKSLNIDLINEERVIDSKVVGPLKVNYTQKKDNLTLPFPVPVTTKYYRHTVICNALRRLPEQPLHRKLH